MALAAASLALTAGCGGDDDASTDNSSDAGVTVAATATAETSATSSDAASADTAAPSDTTEPAETPASTAPADTGDTAGGVDLFGISDATQRCQAIFPDGEIDSLFGEPWALDASVNDSLGQTVCSWSTTDEAADDLLSAVLTVQVYSGDPIPAANFIDPDIFDEVTMLDGFGQLAFVENTFGNNYYFLDEPIAGSLSYSEIDFENPGSEPRVTDDQELELFRTFHDRVT